MIPSTKELSVSSHSTSSKRREEGSSPSRKRKKVISRNYLSRIATTFTTTSRITVILTNF